MRFSYVLPDPLSYRDWAEFEGDLACVKRAGYDAVELQIADPAAFDEARVRQALEAARLAAEIMSVHVRKTMAHRYSCRTALVRWPAAGLKTNQIGE